MDNEYIDFISEYCDRWCERCPFTSRCSAYAVQAATAMCGDFSEALELAVGRPHPEGNEPDEDEDEDREWLADMNGASAMTPEQEAECARQQDARDARIRATPVAAISHAYGMLAHQWLLDRLETAPPAADAVVREAFEIVSHDALLIATKLARAQRSGSTGARGTLR